MTQGTWWLVSGVVLALSGACAPVAIELEHASGGAAGADPSATGASGGTGGDASVGGPGGEGAGDATSGGSTASAGKGGSQSSAGGRGGSAAGGTANTGGSLGSGATGNTGNTGGTGNAGDSSGSGGAGNISGSGGGGGTGPAPGCGTALEASPLTNYSFDEHFSMAITNVKPKSNLHFVWSGLTADMRGRSMQPTEIDMVEIGLWHLNINEFMQKLRSDTLSQSDLVIIGTILPVSPEDTLGDLYDMTELGQPIPPETIDQYFDATSYPPASYIYTVAPATGTELGRGTRMIQAFQLDPDSDNLDVAITPQSTQIDVMVDLHSLTRPAIQALTPAIHVDWTAMTTTAQGLPFDPMQITRVRVGAYSLPVAEMEQPSTFVNLDTLADDLYEAQVVAGTSFDLSTLRDPKGNPFPGINGGHTWLLALDCGNCENPAPWYMTVLLPCATGAGN